jgi:hypothetical protein
MPTEVKIDGQSGSMSDLPNADGSYNVSSPSGIPMGSVDQSTASRIRATNTSRSMAQAPSHMRNAMLDGYGSTGANESLGRLQGAWTTMVLAILWRIVRYYFRTLFKGPWGDRIGVIAAPIIGFIVLAVATSRSQSADDSMLLIGVIIFWFGGAILGPVGGFIQRNLFSPTSASS